MVKKNDKEQQSQEMQVAVPETPHALGHLEGSNPDDVVKKAAVASSALQNIVSQKKKKVVINGEQYLEFEDWQTLGKFDNATVKVEWTKRIMPDEANGIYAGWEARAVVVRNGQEISSAEAQCTRGEIKWKTRDDYQIRSMAQTRACAKALRSCYSWVAVLAGFKGTPAEEMEAEIVQEPVLKRYTAKVPQVTEQNLREQIWDLLQKLGVTKQDDPVKFTFEVTGLDLTNKENYPEIIGRLTAKVELIKGEESNEPIGFK